MKDPVRPPYVQYPQGYVKPPIVLMYDSYAKKAHTQPIVSEPLRQYSGSGNIGSYCCSYCGHRSSTCMYAMEHTCVADPYYAALKECTNYEVTNNRYSIALKHKALITEGIEFNLNPNGTITLIGKAVTERVYTQY